jgi:hypothetical protein
MCFLTSLEKLGRFIQRRFQLDVEKFSWKVLQAGGPRYAADPVLSAAKGTTTLSEVDELSVERRC